ncbi:hypothetical protein K8S19_08155 [bacterium]|nr:hypothetical protein [bacterium]
MRKSGRAAEHQNSRASEQRNSRTAEQQNSRTAEQQNSRAVLLRKTTDDSQSSSRGSQFRKSEIAEQVSIRAAEQQEKANQRSAIGWSADHIFKLLELACTYLLKSEQQNSRAIRFAHGAIV